MQHQAHKEEMRGAPSTLWEPEGASTTAGTSPNRPQQTPAPGLPRTGAQNLGGPDHKTRQLRPVPVGFRGRSGVGESRDNAGPAVPCLPAEPHAQRLRRPAKSPAQNFLTLGADSDLETTEQKCALVRFRHSAAARTPAATSRQHTPAKQRSGRTHTVRASHRRCPGAALRTCEADPFWGARVELFEPPSALHSMPHLPWTQVTPPCAASANSTPQVALPRHHLLEGCPAVLLALR